MIDVQMVYFKKTSIVKLANQNSLNAYSHPQVRNVKATDVLNTSRFTCLMKMNMCPSHDICPSLPHTCCSASQRGAGAPQRDQKKKATLMWKNKATNSTRAACLQTPLHGPGVGGQRLRRLQEVCAECPERWGGGTPWPAGFHSSSRHHGWHYGAPRPPVPRRCLCHAFQPCALPHRKGD